MKTKKSRHAGKDSGAKKPLLNKRKSRVVQKKSELVNYVKLLSEMADLCCVCDTKGNIVYVNPVFEKFTGHKPKEFLGKSFKSLFYRENSKKALEVYTKTLRGESLRDELCFKDTGIVFEFKSNPIRDKSGNIIGVMGTAMDITERKKTEQFMSQLTSIIEMTDDFVGYADAKTLQILYINKAGRKMVGIGARDNVTRLNVADVHPEWANKMLSKKVFPDAMRKGVWRGECAFLHRDGREIPVLMVAMAHKNERGEVKTFSTISRNISKRKQM